VPAPSDTPCRVQLSRAKGWKMPPNTVKVSRRSKWGNPYKVGDRAYVTATTRGEYIGEHITLTVENVIELFRADLESTGYADVGELSGKNLACWCALDQPCHADVLLEIANRPIVEAGRITADRAVA